MAEGRERWGGRLPFIMAAIGSAVGLGNVWRFPAQAYKNGGGAFLIPYFIALITTGIPLMIVEYSLGQKFQKGAPQALAAVSKKFRWVGWLAILTAAVITFYYVAVMAWAFHYSIASFDLDWTKPAAVRVADPVGAGDKVISPDRVVLYMKYKDSEHKARLKRVVDSETGSGVKPLLLSEAELKELEAAEEARSAEDKKQYYVSVDENAKHYFREKCLGGFAPGQWGAYRGHNAPIDKQIASLQQEKRHIAENPNLSPSEREEKKAAIDTRIEEQSSRRISYLGEMFQLSPNTAIWCGVVWLAIFFIIFKGVRVVGKVVMWTVSLPVLLLLILLIRGITLDGATDGILYYLTPSWDALKDPNVWLAAYGQIFFSLSLGFGVLIAYASYMPEDSDVSNNAFITSFANCATSFFAAFAVFSVLGYLAHVNDTAVKDVVDGGPGLVFVTYPIAIAKIGGLWGRIIGVVFFFCLLLLGIDSAFSLVEGFLAAVKDRFPRVRKAFVTGAFCVVGFVCSLPFVTSGGLMWLDIVDNWMTNYGLVTVGLLECVAVAYFFREREIEEFVNERSEIRLGAWFEVFIKYVTPAVLIFLLGNRFLKDMQKTYEGYDSILPGAVGVAGWGVFVAIITLALALARDWTKFLWLATGGVVFAGFWLWLRLARPELGTGQIAQAACMAAVGATLLFGGFFTCLRLALRSGAGKTKAE